jgi:hypothetical protein
VRVALSFVYTYVLYAEAIWCVVTILHCCMYFPFLQINHLDIPGRNLRKVFYHYLSLFDSLSFSLVS